VRSSTSFLRVSGPALAALILLAGCAATKPAPPDRAALIAEAAARGFTRLSVGAPDLPLAAWLRATPGASMLTVYIEGDGAAWPRRDRPPDDPTPSRPVAFGLAVADGAPAVAYLARPCQYDRPPSCRVADWTTDRFSAGAVSRIGASLDDLRARSGTASLTLVGYSGGAFPAARLAATRDDVAALVTVAGVLDPAAWTRHHGVSPLPALDHDTAAALAGVPQRHLIGAEDTLVPPDLARAVLARLGRPETARIVPGFDHACCWVAAWPDSMPSPDRP
jgi:pimeloyl-ACP methyl ester carboxylesterase